MPENISHGRGEARVAALVGVVAGPLASDRAAPQGTTAGCSRARARPWQRTAGWLGAVAGRDADCVTLSWLEPWTAEQLSLPAALRPGDTHAHTLLVVA